jgi:hypothetical protein
VQHLLQPLVARRVAGGFHGLLILAEELGTFPLGKTLTDDLRIERIFRIDRLCGHILNLTRLMAADRAAMQDLLNVMRRAARFAPTDREVPAARRLLAEIQAGTIEQVYLSRCHPGWSPRPGGWSPRSSRR